MSVAIFPRDANIIELRPGPSAHSCGLKPDFWQRSERRFAIPVLCAWLESKNFYAQPGDAPVPLALIPSGKNCYRVQPVGGHCTAKDQARP